MPISGNKEMSDYYATIPIKKRKLPMFQSSSPPLEEQSCLPVTNVQNYTVDDKSSNLCLESSPLSTNVGTGFNDDKKLLLGIKKEINTDSKLSLVGSGADLIGGEAKVPMVFSDKMDSVDCQVNILRFSDQKTEGVTMVDLPLNAAPATVVVKNEVINKLADTCTPVLFRTPETVRLLPKTPLVPAFIISPNASDFKQNPDQSYNTLLCLSINEDKCLGHKCDVHSDRLNWDLNTTIDHWEGPDANGVAPGPVFFSETKMSADIHYTEPVMSSREVLGAISDAGEQFHGETDTISVSYISPSGQITYEDSLPLGLTALASPTLRVTNRNSLAKKDSGRVPLNSNMVEVLISAGNSSPVCYNMVKSEPSVGDVKLDNCRNRCSTMGLPEVIEKGIIERGSSKAANSFSSNPDEDIEPRLIKSEPVQGVRETEVKSCTSIKKVVQLQDNVSSASQVLLKSGDATSQLEISISKEEVHLETKTTLGTSKMDQLADMNISSQGHEIKESKADNDMKYSSEPGCLVSYAPMDSCRDGEDSIRYNNIMNMPVNKLEEDSCESDCKANSNNDTFVRMHLYGKQDSSRDSKYTDCEHTVAKVLKQQREEDKRILNDNDDKVLSAFSQDIAQPPHWSNGNIEDQGETSDDQFKECADSAKESGQITSRGIYFQVIDQVIKRDNSFQESSTIEESEAIKMAVNVKHKRLCDFSGKSDIQMGHNTEDLLDEAINGGGCIKTSASHINDVKFKGADKIKEMDPTLLKPESTITVNDVDNASNSGSNRSRIINLPQGYNMTSPCMPGFLTVRSFLSTARREKYAGEDEKVFPQRDRADCYADDPRRFERDRFRTPPYKKFKMDQIRGRGRGRGRAFRQRDGWDVDHNFSIDVYDGPPDCHVPRHKHSWTRGNAKVENNSYRNNPSRVVGLGRGGMRSTRDVSPLFCHPSSRRISTGDKDVTRTRSIQTTRRFPGNILSSRRTYEDKFRHDEFSRVLPEDRTSPIVNSSRPTYQRFISRFDCGNGYLSNIQRKNHPQIRSKSPVRFETHSNRPWSSPQRGLPDGLNEFQELTQNRSPTTYKMEMPRSPGHHSFGLERVSRRCSSPYLAQPSPNLLDVESGRMDRPRSANADKRIPSNRNIPRNTRRLDIVDPQEMIDNEKYFGRVHELGADRKGAERRKSGDRCGNIGPLCPPSNSDVRNMQYDSDKGPRPVRLCTEEGSDRVNLRKRDLDRRIKSRPGIAQGRMRNLDEEERNYQENKQEWHDNSFDNTSRIKRRY